MMPINFMAINEEDDRSKMEQLWTMYHGLMLFEAKKFFNNIADAEDAISEVCVKIINNLSKIDELSSYQTRSYLVYIVRSVCIDILRKAKKSMEEFGDMLDDVPDKDVDILPDLVMKEGYETIREAIKSLPDHLKDVTFLALVNNYSHAEISELLGITESASKMRLYRAKKEIRKKLAGDLNG